MIRRTALVLFFTSFLLMGITPISAAAAVTVAKVSAGGMDHLIVYPLNDDSKATRVEAALPTIIMAYEALWKAKNNAPMAFQMLIDTELEAPSGDSLSDAAFEAVKLPVPSAPAEWTGTTESNDTNTCHIKLYDASSLNGANELEFELAIDAAKCYLVHNISAEQQDWWYEGLSLWMALQVYSPPPTPLATMQKDYGDNYNSNLFNASEEAVYFWEYLLGSQNQNPPFADVPALASAFGKDAKQFLPITPDLFYGLADVVAADGLSWQPSADDLADDKDLSGSSLPADVDLDLEENAIYIAHVTLPTPEEGKGVTVTADGLADSGTLAGVGSAGSFTPIADGEPLDVCGQSDFTVIAGRTLPENASSESLGGPSLTVSIKDDCGQAKVPPCIVGTWESDVPYTSSNGSFTLDGLFQQTYNADGSYTMVFTNYVVSFTIAGQDPYLFTYVSATAHGTISFERDPKIAGRYNVTNWQNHIDPSSHFTTTVNGETNDVPGTIPDTYFGDSVPTYYQCDTDDAKNSHVMQHISGPTAEQLGATEWPFTRVP